MSNARANTAQVKDRSEVAGGGAKPWRQKGTGRARHGSSRSPIWRGGGVTHGPTNERNYDKKINKKVAKKAFAMILSKKATDGEIILVDSLAMDVIKTKEAVSIISAIAKNDGLEKLSTKRKNAAILALSDRNDNTEKSFRNIPNLKLDLVQNMNVLDLLKVKFLVIEAPEKSFEVLSSRVTAKSVKSDETPKATKTKKEDAPKKKVVKKEDK
jgi:large subunit ribosomal protein L4